MGHVDSNKKALDSAKKAKEFSPSVQYAITKVLPNIINGAFWGFTDLKDIQEHIAAIKSDANITARKLGNACLLEVNPSFLLNAVVAIDPQAISQNDFAGIKKASNDAIIEFEKFLINRGKKEGGFAGVVGIYCVNDVTTITNKGVNYPAFRITMQKALEIMNQYGYVIRVGNTYMRPADAMNSGQALWDSTALSPTNTGVFINISSTLNPAQMKEVEKQFKAKYGLNK